MRVNRHFCFFILLSLPALLLRAEGKGDVVAATASPPAPSETTAQIPPEILAALAEEIGWTASVNLHTSAGYNDNLLLSYTNPEGSAFERSGVESLIWRVPRNRIDYLAFFNAEDTRYFHGVSVHHESEAYAGLEWRYRWPEVLNFTFDAQGYYLDQVFDISDTEITRVVAELRLTGLKVGPTVRWSIWRGLWLEGVAKRDRQKFRDGANDAWVSEYSGRLGWEPSDRLELSVAATERRWDYGRHPRYRSNGTPIDGLLVVHEREWEGRVVATLGAGRHWKTTTRAGGLDYLDNGSGFLNYVEHHAAQELEWGVGQWSLHVEGEVWRKKYGLQTVGIGSAASALVKTGYSANARLERKLSDRWTVYAEYNWDDTASNDLVASYHMKEGLLGARWSWEK